MRPRPYPTPIFTSPLQPRGPLPPVASLPQQKLGSLSIPLHLPLPRSRSRSQSQPSPCSSRSDLTDCAPHAFPKVNPLRVLSTNPPQLISRRVHHPPRTLSRLPKRMPLRNASATSPGRRPTAPVSDAVSVTGFVPASVSLATHLKAERSTAPDRPLFKLHYFGPKREDWVGHRELGDTAQPKTQQATQMPTPPPSASPPSLTGPVDIPVPPHRGIGKGFGLLSIQRIPRGGEIIREKPFIKFNLPVTKAGVKQSYSRLSDRNRIIFLSFPWTTKDVADEFVGVAETNSIPLSETDEKDIDDDNGDDEGDKLVANTDDDVSIIVYDSDNDEPAAKPRQSGLFENISRVNHSCSPNSDWRWDESREELVLYAIDDIEANTEITGYYLTYHEVLLSHDERQKRLITDFGFACLCRRCGRSPTDIHKSDKALTWLRKTLQRWDDVQDDEWMINYVACDKYAIDEIERVIKCAQRENRLTILDQAYQQLFFVHAAWGREKEAMAAVGKLYKILRIKLGDERAAASPAAIWLKHPRRYSMWGCMTEVVDDSTFCEDDADDGEEDDEHVDSDEDDNDDDDDYHDDDHPGDEHLRLPQVKPLRTSMRTRASKRARYQKVRE